MACDASTRIAAIVSMAGASWKDPSRCHASTPVAVLEAHGSDDEVVLFDGGGPVRPGMGKFPSAVDTVATWAKINGCTGPLAPTGQVFHFDARHPDNETIVARYEGCPDDEAVELWTMQGTSHYTDLLPAWTDAMWTFLAAHPKP
jgi:polyhydroxybutyrate depolymerase